jgi:hypothetical protein
LLILHYWPTLHYRLGQNFLKRKKMLRYC